MEPERWRQISRIYSAAQDRPPAARAAFLHELCGGDALLQREVESLLAHEGAAAEFLERPPGGIDGTAVGARKGGARISVGARFGDYEVVGWLASGGMGEVYRARDLTLERTVALKFLAPDLTRDSDRLARFRQEARAASSSITRTSARSTALAKHRTGSSSSRWSTSLARRSRARLGGKRRPLPEALDVAIQIASALSAAHAAGIVHRDLKPENVMVRPDGLVKVVDFGHRETHARRQRRVSDATHSAFRTDTGIVAGTAAYMSPEQARGLEVDARTDIWSLGVILYEMVTGSSPFAGETSSDVLAAILDREPPPLSQFDPAVPSELQRIVRKALRKDRNQRYQVMQELLLDLRALRDEAGLGAGSAGAIRRRKLWLSWWHACARADRVGFLVRLDVPGANVSSFNYSDHVLSGRRRLAGSVAGRNPGRLQVEWREARQPRRLRHADWRWDGTSPHHGPCFRRLPGLVSGCQPDRVRSTTPRSFQYLLDFSLGRGRTEAPG